ncbi:hypothetical protein AB0D71_33420 [Streptomyces avermitilis]|uniref:hypothetical protein n=1 Tax=Streptomyces avermitilis TaxID=33903 RepID=UPI0034047E7A
MDAGAGVTPIEVRVPVAQDGTPGGGATVGGMPVVARAGETLQEAVLNYLHRLTLATGHPVLASVHDERIGCVVPIRVHGDGSSEFTGEPVRVGTAGTPAGGTGAAGGGDAAAPPPPPPPPPPRPVAEPSVPQRPVAGPVGPPVSGDVPQGPPRRDKATHLLRAVAEPTPAAQWPPPQQPEAPSAPAPRTPVPPPPVTPAPAPASASAPAPAARPSSTPTHVLRALPESAATHRPEQVGTPETPKTPKAAEGAEAVESAAEDTPVRAGGAVSTFVLRAVPERAPWITAAPGLAQALPGAPADHGTPAPAPGTVSPPTGAFGPAPTTATPPPGPAPWEPAPSPAPAPAPAKGRTPTPDAGSHIGSGSGSGSGADADPDPYAAPAWKPTPTPRTVPVAEVEEVKEPPVREFDSVAEAVLAPDSGSGPDGVAAGPLAAPMARINEAVKQGRIEEAAAMAEEAAAGAAATLGPEHPDVLRLRELTAYIAYLAGDALRSFHLSLDLARLRRRARDARGAYGNVQSAAAAWRAVRDPVQGLHLGRDLIGVWTELAAEPGPAAEDLDQLDSARNRMGRLAERARTLTENP